MTTVTPTGLGRVGREERKFGRNIAWSDLLSSVKQSLSDWFDIKQRDKLVFKFINLCQLA
jgi:hypothetical protein